MDGCISPWSVVLVDLQPGHPAPLIGLIIVALSLLLRPESVGHSCDK